jgi:hypothetical protein
LAVELKPDRLEMERTVKRIGACLTTLTFVFVSLPASAVYNANIAGVLTHVAAYADGDYVYFTLQNQPLSHPSCGAQFFVIADTVSADRRKAMYARLLAAHATGESLTIGYDATGDCAHGYIRAHRVG